MFLTHHFQITEMISLDNNQLSGSLPIGISALTALNYFSIHNNNFQGPIPSDLFYSKSLEYIEIHSNQFTGQLLRFDPNSKIRYLYASNNLISGTIPDELGNVTNLEMLYLSNNRFNGTIPKTIMSLSKLYTCKL